MNKTGSLIRIAILLALFSAGLLGMLSIPMDASPRWYSDLILSKAIGCLSLLAFAKLYARWRKTDRWIRAYDRWNNDQH